MVMVMQVHSRGKSLAKDVDFDKIARRTPGFTGADLQNLMNEAAILAARRDLKEISKDEIADALERIIAGPEKKNAVVSEEKKKLVAYHGTTTFCSPSGSIKVAVLINPSFIKYVVSMEISLSIQHVNASF